MIRVRQLPTDDDTCGWWRLQPDGAAYPALSGDQTCDVAIVGAGWTGLAAARQLAALQPDAKILLLDAGRIGYGAAGRNSGFLFDVPFVFSPDAYRGREADGRQEIALYRASVDHMRRFVQDTGVDCDWSEIGQYHVAADAEGEKELAVIDAGLRALGEAYTTLDRSALKAALGTDFYRTAIHTPGTVQINPLALARAYAAAMPDNVRIHEQTSVSAIEPGTSPTITTAHGQVRAGKVLLTTNAFLTALIGTPLPIVPVMTFGGVTEPVTPVQAAAIGGQDRWGVVPAALFGTSMRRLGDGRYLVRSTYAYAPRFAASPALRARAQQRQVLSLRQRFPALNGIDMQWSWGGVVSFFRGANGFFDTVAPNVLSAVTSGMPVCILYGQQLAEWAAGGGGEALEFVRRRSRPASLPPRAIVGPAARLMAARAQRKARHEL